MSNHLEKFNQLRKLSLNAEKAETFWSTFNETTAKDQVDKYRAGFGVDDRNPSFAVKTVFSSHIGTYGSSSVYRFDSFDRDLMGEYMVMAMNALSDDLFQKAAELMRKDAEKLLGDARQEVQRMQDALAEIELQ